MKQVGKLKILAVATMMAMGLSGCIGGGNETSSGGETISGGETSSGGEIPPAPTSYTVSATAGTGGNISPGSITVVNGDDTEFTMTPNTGYRIATVIGCGGNLFGNTYITGAITAACEVSALFEEITVLDFLAGKYVGVLVSPRNIFFNNSSSITFEIDNSKVKITKESFSDRSCILDGELTGDAYPVTGSGSFRCSDFSTGSWSTDMIAKTDASAMITTIHMEPSDGGPYTIMVAGFRGVTDPAYDPNLSYRMHDVASGDFLGVYDGHLQSSDSCASLTFSNSINDLTITIEGDEIELKQDAFFEGVCRYKGEIQSFDKGVISAAGSYMCSNFDEGTWSTEQLVMTGTNSMFAELNVDVPSRGCNYQIRYLGFKP